MDRVIKYVNEKFKHAGHSKEAHSQREELIAGLHDKISDAMSKGKSEDEAFRDAIASLDGLEELTQVLNAKRRTVYINKLRFHHSLLTFGLIALEILICGAYYLANWRSLPGDVVMMSYRDMPCFGMGMINPVLIILAIALFATTIYPLVRGILYRRNTRKVEQVELGLRQSMTVAVLGWLVVTLVLTVWNIAPMIEKNLGPAIWFQWPALAMAGWPLSVLIYGWLYKRRRYLA